MRAFLRYAHILGVLVPPLDHLLKAPRVENSPTDRILTTDDVQRLLNATTTARDRLLVRLLYTTGLRIAEACRLTWAHVLVDRHGTLLRIQGKGGRVRALRLTQRLTTELMALQAATTGAGKETPLFVGRHGLPLSTRQAARILKSAARRANLPANVSPHWLRHSHASHALDAGAPIHLVQQTLGHTSIATTGRYLHARPHDTSGNYLALGEPPLEPPSE